MSAQTAYATRATPDKRSVTGPASFRGWQYLQIAVFTALVALVAPAVATNPYTQTLVNIWILYALAALGFYVIFGLAGQFAFSQAFLMGIGAYVSAWVTKSFPTPVGMLVAVLAVAAIAFVFALITLRTSHFYFAIATFGLSSIGIQVIHHWPVLGGNAGQIVGIAPGEWFGRVFFFADDVFWLLLAFLALGLVVTAMIERSPLRREA